MNCPICQWSNPPGASVCAKCGTPLASTAPQPANPFTDQASPFGPTGPVYSQRSPTNIADDPTVRMLLPVGRSIYSILAGYLGLLSLAFCFLGPFAILFGVLAIIDIRKNPKRAGIVRAIVGIVLGVLGTVFLCIVIVSWIAQAGRN